MNGRKKKNRRNCTSDVNIRFDPLVRVCLRECVAARSYRPLNSDVIVCHVFGTNWLNCSDGLAYAL